MTLAELSKLYGMDFTMLILTLNFDLVINQLIDQFKVDKHTHPYNGKDGF